MPIAGRCPQVAERALRDEAASSLLHTIVDWIIGDILTPLQHRACWLWMRTHDYVSFVTNAMNTAALPHTPNAICEEQQESVFTLICNLEVCRRKTAPTYAQYYGEAHGIQSLLHTMRDLFDVRGHYDSLLGCCVFYDERLFRASHDFTRLWSRVTQLMYVAPDPLPYAWMSCELDVLCTTIANNDDDGELMCGDDLSHAFDDDVWVTPDTLSIDGECGTARLFTPPERNTLLQLLRQEDTDSVPSQPPPLVTATSSLPLCNSSDDEALADLDEHVLQM